MIAREVVDSEVCIHLAKSFFANNHSDQICTQTYTGKTLEITSIDVTKRTLSQMDQNRVKHQLLSAVTMGEEGSPLWENAPNHEDGER